MSLLESTRHQLFDWLIDWLSHALLIKGLIDWLIDLEYGVAFVFLNFINFITVERHAEEQCDGIQDSLPVRRHGGWQQRHCAAAPRSGNTSRGTRSRQRRGHGPVNAKHCPGRNVRGNGGFFSRFFPSFFAPVTIVVKSLAMISAEITMGMGKGMGIFFFVLEAN